MSNILQWSTCGDPTSWAVSYGVIELPNVVGEIIKLEHRMGKLVATDTSGMQFIVPVPNA